jgi:hypothetical protein
LPRNERLPRDRAQRIRRRRNNRRRRAFVPRPKWTSEKGVSGMKIMLLAAAASLAAIAFPAAPAGAEHRAAFVGIPAAHSGHMSGSFHGDRRGHRDGRGDRRFGDSVVLGDWYGGEWAQYNNRSWDSDSYNDWWHDRPSRAYPAWVQHNEGCARMWYAADTLRC